MKKALAMGAAAALFSLNAAAGDTRDAPVAVNTDGLTANIAAKVEQNAAQGERALARYLETVRPYRQVTLHDVTQPRAEAPQQKFDPEREYKRHAREWHKSVHVTG